MTKADKFAKFADTNALRNNLKRKSVRGVLFMFGAGGADLIYRAVSTFILARLLSPADFGLVGMIFSVTGIAEQFSELGLWVPTIQSRELTHQQVTNLFWINVGTGCVFCLAIGGLAPVIAGFYNSPDLVAMTLAMSTTFIWGGLTVQHQALLSRQLKQGQLAAVRLSAGLLSLIVAIALAINHLGVWALAWREITRTFLTAVGMWLICGWIPGWPRKNADIKGLLACGGHLTLSQVPIACVSQLDRLLVGKFFGAGPLGLYRQAQQLILAPIEQLRQPLNSVAAPSLSILQADPGRYRRFVQRIVLVIALVTMPMGLFIAIYAGEITHVILGPKWIDATVFLRIFGIVAFLKPCLDTTGLVMVTFGLSRRILALSVMYNVVFAALMFAGTYWGSKGVALSNVLVIVLLMFPLLFLSFRGTPVTVGAFFSTISVPVVASGVMAGVALAFHSVISQYDMAVSLFSGLAVAVVVYVLVLLVLPRGRREIMGLISAVLVSLKRHREAPVTGDETEKLVAG